MPKIDYSIKNFSHEFKDFDEKKGIVVAYANAYDFKDSDGDISAKGSFTKSAKENYERIGVFRNHDPDRPVGIPLEIDTKDSFGLKTVTKFDLSIPDGKDMFNHILFKKDNNRNTELSIGFEVLKRDQKNHSIITEYKLWEYSFLTAWAANSLSTVQDVKNMHGKESIIQLIEKYYNVGFSDQRLKSIENILKSLDKEPEISTPEVEPITPELIKSLFTFKSN